ncbi:hypothetical protein POPTR_006G228650v4 [Populus trichocarpa]|uniref:Uncharacterized protein n=1 Tax=Populus trichocarpa TaxID=3694 RepID=A0ACC0SVX7_POPTR|nr:hypothetical protein BDE02_06G199300 [Populus trichocarpa]KAI9393393.1 hypothetical protein POPTR_006G228650v4 [Populus trichocarpa]
MFTCICLEGLRPCCHCVPTWRRRTKITCVVRSNLTSILQNLRIMPSLVMVPSLLSSESLLLSSSRDGYMLTLHIIAYCSTTFADKTCIQSV